eukprot:6126200-Ditylum_brightwellii.AAC.1
MNARGGFLLSNDNKTMLNYDENTSVALRALEIPSLSSAASFLLQIMATTSQNHQVALPQIDHHSSVCIGNANEHANETNDIFSPKPFPSNHKQNCVSSSRIDE